MQDFTDKQTGISTIDIRTCSDKPQLLQWKEELFMDITNIEQQIEAYEKKEEEDLDWYLRARAALNVKKKLDFLIDNKLTILQDEQKRQYIEKKEANDSSFLDFIDWLLIWMDINDICDYNSRDILTEYNNSKI